MKKSKGITWGCFDGLSEAHLKVLGEAKRSCDYLIVGVSDDNYIREKKKSEPILGWEQRMLIVSKLADKVIPQSKYFTKEKACQYFKPDVIFVGDEYRNKEWDGKKLGIPVCYIKHYINIHSTNIRKLIE